MERFEPNHKLDYNTLQTPNNHVYSYAYYEPGAAKCHTNIPTPQKELAPSTAPIPGPSKSPPRNSIRALLAKSFRSRAPTSSEERHTYTTRYGTQENLYEEVNDQKIRKVLSDNRIVSVNSTMVKEELRRVQHNHFRVLDELNLSLEALIMPSTPPDTSPASTSDMKGGPTPHCSSSMENLSSTLTSIELKDHTCINPEFDEGDLDSGFSGSGSSSGASYNESLRYYKTGAVMIPPTQANAGATTTTLPHMRSCRSSSSTSTKGSLNSDDHTSIGCIMTSSSSAASSPFNFGRRCSDTQRSATAGTKPKKHFWTIKQWCRSIGRQIQKTLNIVLVSGFWILLFHISFHYRYWTQCIRHLKRYPLGRFDTISTHSSGSIFTQLFGVAVQSFRRRRLKRMHAPFAMSHSFLLQRTHTWHSFFPHIDWAKYCMMRSN